MRISALHTPYDGLEVWLDGEILSPKESQKVINHSPDGFSAGYLGSGVAQLALATNTCRYAAPSLDAQRGAKCNSQSCSGKQ